MHLASCEKCGRELPEDAFFCPKCGVRTPRGRKEETKFPWQDALAEVGEEIDRALSVAAKEIEKGLETAKEEIRKATSKETMICPECKEVSYADARFCWGCGKKLV